MVPESVWTSSISWRDSLLYDWIETPTPVAPEAIPAVIPSPTSKGMAAIARLWRPVANPGWGEGQVRLLGQ